MCRKYDNAKASENIPPSSASGFTDYKSRPLGQTRVH